MLKNCHTLKLEFEQTIFSVYSTMLSPFNAVAQAHVSTLYAYCFESFHSIETAALDSSFQ
jgi:hypothetical protein